jgi:hypothetical protein
MVVSLMLDYYVLNWLSYLLYQYYIYASSLAQVYIMFPHSVFALIKKENGVDIYLLC